MPFYQITITLKSSQVITGIRETENLHIDPVYMEYFIKANQHYHHDNIVKFNCVMISRHSQEYQEYAAALKKPEPMDPVYEDPSSAIDKYRARKEAPKGPGWGEIKRKEK